VLLSMQEVCPGGILVCRQSLTLAVCNADGRHLLVLLCPRQEWELEKRKQDEQLDRIGVAVARIDDIARNMGDNVGPTVLSACCCSENRCRSEGVTQWLGFCTHCPTYYTRCGHSLRQ
jgi:hypothetical protein